MLYCFIWSYVFNTILFHLVIWYVFNAILLHLIIWYVFNKSLNFSSTHSSSSDIIITIYHYHEHLHDTTFIISYHHHNIPLFWTLTWHSIHQHLTSSSQYIIITNTYMTQHSKQFKLSLQKHVFLIICSSLKHENNLKFHKNERATSFLLWWRAKTKKNHLKQKGQH